MNSKAGQHAQGPAQVFTGGVLELKGEDTFLCTTQKLGLIDNHLQVKN